VTDDLPNPSELAGSELASADQTGTEPAGTETTSTAQDGTAQDEAAQDVAGPDAGGVPVGRRRSRLARVGRWSLATVLTFALLAGVLGVWAVRRAFPQYDGTLRLRTLSAPVTVYRDDHAIPQLYARNADDLFTAQGYVAAQERFWEMDFRRHITGGRLSEMFGRSEVDTDEYLRTMGWRRVAEQEWNVISADSRRYLTDYANGVDAYLDGKSPGTVSLEYTVLGLQNSGYTIAKWDPIDSLAWLKALGFRTPEKTWDCSSGDELVAAIDELDKVRRKFSFETDGAVIKLNSFAQREKAGFTSKAPRWAIAYKYAAEQAETTLLDIDIQVGRTGKLAPVAKLKPLTVGGVVVQNATLHNEDEIARKDVRISDTVVVQRAGDVIPQIVRVVLEKRPRGAKPFAFPHKCPVCGSHAVREIDEKTGKEDVDRRCTGGLICSAQAVERLRHFVSRLAFDIEGFGGIYIETLHEKGLLKEPAGAIFADDIRRQLAKLDSTKTRFVAGPR
jgi:hypothetical protein